MGLAELLLCDDVHELWVAGTQGLLARGGLAGQERGRILQLQQRLKSETQKTW